MERREERTVIGGALVVCAALLLAFVVVPFIRRWQLREVELETTRASIAELTGLVQNRRSLDSAATAAENLLAVRGRRVIHARSATLAASAMQSFLQDASDASRLVVTRLDVAPSEESAATSLPATLTAHTDIHGLAELLAHLEHGPRVVRVERMTVQMNSALRGAADMLQLALTLRAPVLLDETPGAPVSAGAPLLASSAALPADMSMNGAASARDADASTAGIVQGNVFSASRRAPASRFSPPSVAGGAYETPVGDGAGSGAASGAGAAYGDAASMGSGAASPASEAESIPHLYGVVENNGERRALLALRAGESPRLLSVGDRHGGYRVTAIEQDRVVLAYAGGVRTLRLTRPASRDSLDTLP